MLNLIVDVHYHFFRQVSYDLVDSINPLVERWSGITKSRHEVMPMYEDYVDDIHCNKLVKRMDESGIDLTIINIIDDIDLGFDDEHILQRNKVCSQAARMHPTRVLALAGIDPRRKDASTLVRQCIEEFGMRGLKWHPDFGYYPNSKEAYTVLEVVQELGVPLLTHCGPWRHAKFVHPILLDDVALDFPNIDIIAAHMGNLWWRDWAALARHRANIYGDLAMWQLMAVSQRPLFRRYLREILDLVGPHQLLFGTDGPVFEPHISNKRWIELIHSLLSTNEDGIVFNTTEIDAILGGNAARIFKLDT